MDDYDFVPALKKKSAKPKAKEEFKGLLGDDDDDDDEVNCFIIIVINRNYLNSVKGEQRYWQGIQ